MAKRKQDSGADSRPNGKQDKSAGSKDPHARREAERYDRPIPSREAIIKLLADRGELLKQDSIARALDLSEEIDLEALGKRLRAMVRDGQLLLNRRGGHGVVSKLDLAAGEIIANAEGYGFLKPDDGSVDLYLSPAEMRKVMHGDRVLASIVSVDHRGRRKGSIVSILERRPARLVGHVVTEHGVTMVVPDDSRLHHDLLIPPGQSQDAQSGQIVIAEITEPPTVQRGPIGRIISILGDRLKPSLVVDMAIAQYDLPHEWPQPVVAEVEAMPVNVQKQDLQGRTDLRSMPLVTIDGEDSRDFDDAVWAEPHASGGYRLVVAIADVSHYVRPGTAVDVEGNNRGTSTYFPGFVVPMLPEALSNGLCSLNPDVDRLCMVCDMHVDEAGEVRRSSFHTAVMRSHARLTYTQVWQAIGPRDAEVRKQLTSVLPVLDNLQGLYRVLSKARQQRGAIDFETSEVKFSLSAAGEVESMGSTPRNDAHKLIEECMIAANVQAARFLARKKIPALYRVHAPPPADKYEDLLEFLRQYKLKLPPVEKVTPADYTALLHKVRDKPEFELIQSVLLRSMSMAVYMPENHGHFGLALQAYAHFTSPIRRYPDLLVHRAIHYALGKGDRADYMYSENEMVQLGVHCSQRERRSEEAERDVDDRFKCAWMEKHIGAQFDGKVTGVTSFGLFVEMDESKVSGLVHITQLPNDYYHFDSDRRQLKGERTGQIFRLGDRVRIQVLRASMEDRKIDLRMVEKLDADKPSPQPDGKATVKKESGANGKSKRGKRKR